MTTQERDYEKKEKAFYFRTFKGNFFLPVEQRTLHFICVVGPENYVACSEYMTTEDCTLFP